MASTPVRPSPDLNITLIIRPTLPTAEDLSSYSQEELRSLQADLKESIKERIRKTDELGSHKPHAERQAAEQQLVQQIQKHLEDQCPSK